jgi:hypothetical protein
VEKCGKVWRLDHATAARHEAQDGVCFAAGSGGVIGLRACSACAGDYEDPDRTAGTPDDAETEDREGGALANSDEFPAGE